MLERVLSSAVLDHSPLPPFAIPFHDMSEIAEKPVVRLTETSSMHSRQYDHNSKHFIAFADCEHCARHPNRWSRIRLVKLLILSALLTLLTREYIREPAAEFFGTMILIIFGCGGNCQVVLSSKPAVASSPKGVSP